MAEERFTISLTRNQAGLILEALLNESNDDQVDFGEYGYARCWKDIAKKLIQKGFWSIAIEESGEFENSKERTK